MVRILLETAKPSFVGNAGLSVHKSSEIGRPDRTGPRVLGTISEGIAMLAATLGHPINVEAKLHKLKPGDFFDTHRQPTWQREADDLRRFRELVAVSMQHRG